MHKYKHSYYNKSHIDDIIKCHIMNKILNSLKIRIYDMTELLSNILIDIEHFFFSMHVIHFLEI